MKYCLYMFLQKILYPEGNVSFLTQAPVSVVFIMCNCWCTRLCSILLWLWKKTTHSGSNSGKRERSQLWTLKNWTHMNTELECHSLLILVWVSSLLPPPNNNIMSSSVVVCKSYCSQSFLCSVSSQSESSRGSTINVRGHSSSLLSFFLSVASTTWLFFSYCSLFPSPNAKFYPSAI